MNHDHMFRASLNRQLVNAGCTPSRHSMFEQMRHTFTLRESLTMAYIPVLLTKAAFRFAEDVCRQCASNRLPYKPETRIIRQAIKSYIYSTLGSVISHSTLQLLDEKTDLFFRYAEGDVTTLWMVVNQELKSSHPSLDEEYPFLTDLFCAISLIHYVHSFESKADATVMQRTGLSRTTFSVQEPWDVYHALMSIAGRYTINHTRMIELSVRIISIRVEDIVQQLYEMYSHQGFKSEVSEDRP